MIVKVVGCNGGVAPGYKNTSYLIDGKLLIDAGSVASGLPIFEQASIDHILISHPHLDHISDVAFLADNCFGLKGRPFEIYSNQPVQEAIKTHLMNDIIWPDFSKIPNETNPTLRFHNLIPEKEITLGEFKILPVSVNHPGDALGFIIEKGNKSIVFTQDTAATEKIWEFARKRKNVQAIFTEASFPNKMIDVARSSFHFTPNDLAEEIKKMPSDVPIFIGHLKPNFRNILFKEIEALKNDRIQIMSDDNSYIV